MYGLREGERGRVNWEIGIDIYILLNIKYILYIEKSACNAGDTDPWVRKIPWRRKWQPTPVFLPGKPPWTEEPGSLQSMALQRTGHD